MQSATQLGSPLWHSCNVEVQLPKCQLCPPCPPSFSHHCPSVSAAPATWSQKPVLARSVQGESVHQHVGLWNCLAAKDPLYDVCLSLLGVCVPKSKPPYQPFPWQDSGLHPACLLGALTFFPAYFTIPVPTEEIGQLVSACSLGFSFRRSHTVAHFEHRPFLG